MASFDAKNVSTLEWVGIGAGALGFLSSFFAWASFSVAGFGGGWLSAWNSGFIAWFPVLLLLGAAGTPTGHRLRIRVRGMSGRKSYEIPRKTAQIFVSTRATRLA